jgi:hypothetical protein
MRATGTLPSVELIIPCDRFSVEMTDISEWLTGAHIVSPFASWRRNAAGDLDVAITFARTSEAANFAVRFGGRLAA